MYPLLSDATDMGDYHVDMPARGADRRIDLPSGYRFFPTDAEIAEHYVYPKVIDGNFRTVAMGDVELNKFEPWQLASQAKMAGEELYFYCCKDRKYPTGTRTNRATEKGYWKATGRDREIYKEGNILIGMKKTLVFYVGRAPSGVKSNWIMHEFRLEGKNTYWNLPESAKDDWVVCRIFHKITGGKKGIDLSSESQQAANTTYLNGGDDDSNSYQLADIFTNISGNALDDLTGTFLPNYTQSLAISDDLYYPQKVPVPVPTQSIPNLSFAGDIRRIGEGSSGATGGLVASQMMFASSKLTSNEQYLMGESEIAADLLGTEEMDLIERKM